MALRVRDAEDLMVQQAEELRRLAEDRATLLRRLEQNFDRRAASPGPEGAVRVSVISVMGGRVPVHWAAGQVHPATTRSHSIRHQTLTSLFCLALGCSGSRTHVPPPPRGRVPPRCPPLV